MHVPGSRVLRSPQAVSGYWLLLRPRPKHRKHTTLAMGFGMGNEKLRLGQRSASACQPALGAGKSSFVGWEGRGLGLTDQHTTAELCL